MILPFNVSGLPDTPEAKALKRLENLFNRSSIDVPLGLGGPTTAARMITIGGSFVGVGDSIGVGLTTTLTPPSGASAHGMAIEPQIVRAASGSHAVISAVWIRWHPLTGGAATVGTCATLYVNGMPTEGSNNYTFFVEQGLSRLGGQCVVNGVSPFKDLSVWSGTGTSTSNPLGLGILKATNTVGETLGITFGFAGGMNSAGLVAIQKDTAQQSADLGVFTRTASGGGVTALRWRWDVDGHYVPETALVDIGTTALGPRTIHYATSIKNGATQILGAQGAAVADATDAPSVITQLNALLARARAHGIIAP